MSRHTLSASPSQGNGLSTRQRSGIAQVSVSPVRIQTAEERRTGYGIVVLSGSSGNVLYANETASRYLGAVDEKGNVFRPAVAELVRQMTARIGTGDGERPQSESRRVVVREGTPVLLQAFGIRDRSDLAVLRVVITMQNFSPSLISPESGATPSSL